MTKPTGRPVGRPKKVVDEAVIARLLELHNGNVFQVGLVLGLARNTLWRMITESETLVAKLNEIREGMKDRVESKFYEKALEGDMTAMTRYLAAQARERGWAEKKEVELSGAVGGTFKIVWNIADDSANDNESPAK